MNKLRELWDRLPEKHKAKIIYIALFILYGIAGTMDYANIMGV
jgi:hypothetical protein